jgi:hypothetical protein
MKAEAVLFYAEKFLAGTMFFSHEQAGRYIRALCAQQLHGHLTDAKINTIVEGDPTVMEKFDQDEEGYYNQRMRCEVMKAQGYMSRKKGAGRTKKTGDEYFDKFWAAYPRKVGKQKATESWGWIKDKPGTLELILKALRWQIETEQWQKKDGQYIPHPVTYLNQHRWEDQPIAVKRKSLSEQYRERFPK